MMMIEQRAGREPLLDDRTLIMLLLLERRRQGDPYAACLPGEELVRSLPLHWPEEERASLLRGTTLLHRARAEERRLHEVFTSIVQPLQALSPEAFPADSFSWEALCWAHAQFWSRALQLDLGPLERTLRAAPGQECLVPLLDLCNHRPGCCSTSVTVGQRAAAAGSEGGRDHEYVLRACCSMARGEAVEINYGANGNGELLRAHGFVLEHNVADVCELDMCEMTSASLPPPQDRQALASSLQLPRRFYLFRGGLPAELLDAARLLCVDDEELPSLVAAIRGSLADGPAEDETFDWNAVDWAAEEPLADLPSATSPPSMLSVDAERRALSALMELIERKCANLADSTSPCGPASCAGNPPVTPQPVGSGGTRRWAAAVYVASMRRILNENRRLVQDALEVARMRIV